MMHLVRLAPLGPNTEEAIVRDWLIEVGQTVEAREPLLSVETDKSSIDVESDVSGRLVRRLVEKGAAVRPGEPVAEIET